MNKKSKKIVPEFRFPEFNDNWEKVKLKNVSKYFNGRGFEGDVQEEGKYELITLKSIDSNGNLIHSKRYINDAVPTLKKDTLVMILSEQAPGLLGMTTIIPLDNKFVLNQRVAEIRPNNKVVSFFLSMAINRNQRVFSRLGAGMKVQNISKPNVENYEFYIPTLPEQLKIANCLSSLNDLITLETERLALLTEHKKGLLQQLFPAKGEVKPQYRFPEFKNDGDWEEEEIGQLFRFKQGVQVPIKNQYPIKKEGMVRFIRIIDITGDSEPPRYIKNPGFDHIITKEDLFMIRYGTPGVISIGFKGVIANNLFRLIWKLDSSINSLFWYYAFQKMEKEIYSLSGSSSMPAISFSTLDNLDIKYPENPKEQQKIANCLSSIDDLIEEQSKKIEDLQYHKKGLMQQLFPNVNSL